MKSRGRPTTLTGVWAERVQAAGSIKALAELWGVNVSTIYRWARKQIEISGPGQKLIEAFDKKHKIGAYHES